MFKRQSPTLTILGERFEVRAPRDRARHRHRRAEVLDPSTSAHAGPFAEEYERLRAHKGMTVERARDTMGDISYFGT